MTGQPAALQSGLGALETLCTFDTQNVRALPADQSVPFLAKT